MEDEQVTELVLRNARLADGRLVDVSVVNGLISAVHDAGDRPDGDLPGHDLGGWLLLPAMVEPHAHLDKALTAERVHNVTGDLHGAIEAWISASSAGRFSFEDTSQRASTAMELLLVHGVTAVRTHVNVGAGTQNLEAVMDARSHMAGLMDVQIVALTGNPMTGPEGAANRASLDAAIEAGADLVGGCPHLDPDGPGLISHALTVAAEAGVGVDLHVDETLDPAVLTLRDLARQVIDSGFQNSVSAGHCVTLGMQSPHVQAEVSALVAEAGIPIFPLPQTNLFLQGRDHPSATPRGLTAVAALQKAGVLVAAGADNVQDPFNLVGRSDPLETAALMVMASHQSPESSYSMVSTNARRALGLPESLIQVGDVADLVAIDATSIRAAIADAPMSRRTFRRGALVASTDQAVRIHRSG
ncbi:MAG: amidohydrolase family protein [Acidimicrobiia bacterium]|nr:amidohydrolase family protein [Actinomycetota bacterium]MBL6927308.1 amidohydrolase family protein [Acidimicrobiia bacterium]